MRETVNLSEFREQFSERYYPARPDDSNAPLRAWAEQIPLEGQELRLGGGVHALYPESATEAQVYPSNNTSGLVRPSILLQNQRNVTIDGEGAKLLVRGTPEAGVGSIGIFYTPPMPIVIQNCSNITIRNLSIDWKDPFAVQAEVVENAGDSLVVKILEDREFEVRGRNLYFSGEGWRMPVQRLLAANPENGAILPESGDNFGLSEDYNWSYEQVDSQHVRICGADEKLPPVGSLVLFWLTAHASGSRHSSAIFIDSSNDIRLENVTINHAVGMGVAVQLSRDITLDTVVVEPSGSRRYSLNSDATHFVSCRGSVVVENCRFQNQFDDCVNTHGLFLQVLRQIDEKRILVRCGHPQHQGVCPVVKGDRIEFRGAGDLALFCDATVAKVTPQNSEVLVIECEEAIAQDIPAGALVEDATAYPDIVLRNCDFRWNRARGVLLNGRGKIEVDNCRFKSAGAAIMVETSGDWFESGPVRDLEIHHCHFDDCANVPMWGKGVVTFVNSFASEHPLHDGVRFHHNVVENLNSPLFYGKGLRTLRLHDNVLPEEHDIEKSIQIEDLESILSIVET